MHTQTYCFITIPRGTKRSTIIIRMPILTQLRYHTHRKKPESTHTGHNNHHYHAYNNEGNNNRETIGLWT